MTACCGNAVFLITSFQSGEQPGHSSYLLIKINWLLSSVWRAIQTCEWRRILIRGIITYIFLVVKTLNQYISALSSLSHLHSIIIPSMASLFLSQLSSGGSCSDITRQPFSHSTQSEVTARLNFSLTGRNCWFPPNFSILIWLLTIQHVL